MNRNILGKIVLSILASALVGCAANTKNQAHHAKIPYAWNSRVFTLFIFANLVTGEHGRRADLERLHAERLADALKNFRPELGEWAVVWGPAIYQAPGSTLADNAVYVARQKKSASGRSEYVIAVAAVNSKSFYDWFAEQLNITPQVAWRDVTGGAGSAKGARISSGVDIGFSHLMQLQRGKTLLGFLKEDVDRGARITVAGHSYGGTVAPVMALWLNERQTTWDPARRCEIACLMSGSATPGNVAFAHYYAQRGLAKRTTRIDNSLDLAWRAFDAHAMEAIPSLYLPHIKPSRLLTSSFAKIGAVATAAGGYAPIPGKKITLEGTFAPAESPSSDTEDIRFLKQAQYQHIPAYFSGLGLTKLRDSYQDRSKRGLQIHYRADDIQAFQKALDRIR